MRLPCNFFRYIACSSTSLALSWSGNIYESGVNSYDIKLVVPNKVLSYDLVTKLLPASIPTNAPCCAASNGLRCYVFNIDGSRISEIGFCHNALYCPYA